MHTKHIRKSDRANVPQTAQPRPQSTSNNATGDSRPTWIRCRLKYLSPVTLDHYRLPWKYDPEDNQFIIIKEFVPHDLQRELFEHTRQLNRSTRSRSGSDTRPRTRSRSSSQSHSQRPPRGRRRSSSSSSRSRSKSQPRSQTNSNSDSESADGSISNHTRTTDQVYEPPTDAIGNSLNLEVNIASTDVFLNPGLTTKKTIDVAKGNTSLQNHLGLRSLLKASVMAAHHTPDEEETYKVALKYVDSPKYLADSQFRWM